VLVDDVVTVTEDEIGAAVRWLFREAKMVAEPSGAAAIAAARNGAGGSRPDSTVAILSGGNVVPDQYAALLRG
jgi:threonine dehydratase